MSAASDTRGIDQGFPRFFRINGYAVNSYKFFLCIGIYVGTLATAALASFSGISALRVGLAAVFCALAGLIGARLYFLLVNARFYLKQRSLAALWDSGAGGWSLFEAATRSTGRPACSPDGEVPIAKVPSTDAPAPGFGDGFPFRARHADGSASICTTRVA